MPGMPTATDVAPDTPQQSDLSLQHAFQSAPVQPHTQHSSQQTWLPAINLGTQTVRQAPRVTGSKQLPSLSHSQHPSYKPNVTDSAASFQHQQPHSANSMPLQRGSSNDNTASPCSNGRSVVINGFKKGMPGFEAKERALAACKHFGAVSLTWLRKGKTGCWFVIAQFEKVSLAKSVCNIVHLCLLLPASYALPLALHCEIHKVFVSI